MNAHLTPKPFTTDETGSGDYKCGRSYANKTNNALAALRKARQDGHDIGDQDAFIDGYWDAQHNR